MFFKRPSQQPAEPMRWLEWEHPERQYQTLWISVQDWQYKVFPSRPARSFGSWMYQFEGQCGAGPLKGLQTTGNIEALDRDETPGMLSDYWKVVPDNVEGYASPLDDKDSRFQPSFSVTLYCQESALDWIYRAFAVAATSREGSVGIELRLGCPNNTGGPFWREQWRQEWLLVSSWKVFAGAQLRSIR